MDQFRRVFRHDGLNAQPGDAETEFIRQARLERPLLVKVDGRCGRGGICYSD